MISWREKLCGSVAVQDDDGEMPFDNLQQVLRSNEQLSHGGGFLPTRNPAHLQTTSASTVNVILPTEKYAVMILKNNGQAVIYSEDEKIANALDDSAEDDLLLQDFNK